MNKLYAPWRDRYVMANVRTDKKQDSCVFCEIFSENQDKEQYVLAKTEQAAVLLNLYPYTGGHLLVVPRNHVANLYDLSYEVQNEMMELVSKSMKIIQQELQCDGINFGANLGRDAGAGIPDHMHFHIVPRFRGDTGFLTTVGEAKQVSVDLDRIYKKLQSAFNKSA